MSPMRLFGVWALLAVLMSANGIFRELVLRRQFGNPAADILSAAMGCAIILIVTRWFFRPLAGASAATLLRTSVALVLLTVAFEFAIGRYVDHKSWSDLVANYAIWRGQLWPIVLALIALTPFIWGRWLPPQATHAPG